MAEPACRLAFEYGKFTPEATRAALAARGHQVNVLDEQFSFDTARSIDGNTWRKERTFLYTDLENAGVLYTKQETDPSLYEPDLVEVIVARLAWFISMRIHAMKDLRADMRAEYQGALARAKLTNATGGSDGGEPEPLWAEVR